MKQVHLKTGTLKIDENNILEKLVDYGSRINKKRGFLFVSKVLGKHLPAKPSVMKDTYEKLANLIPKTGEPTLFIGFAETATALGQGVFEAYSTGEDYYIHSTRYNTSDPVLFSFFEEHCHAPSHIFYEPRSEKMKEFLKTVKRVILIDDEVSTGNTANNLVEQLKPILPSVNKYTLLTILNWAEKEYDNFDYLSLYRGTFEFELDPEAFKSMETVVSESTDNDCLDKIIPHGFARYGVGKVKTMSNLSWYKELKGQKILVLGTSEFMFPPYLFAQELENVGVDVYFQATTRSPVNIDGAIKSKLSFKDNYFENIDNFLYNVMDREYDKIFICYETTKLPDDFHLKELLSKKFDVEEIFFQD